MLLLFLHLLMILVLFKYNLDPTQNIRMYEEVLRRSHTPEAMIKGQSNYISTVFPESKCLTKKNDGSIPASLGYSEKNVGLYLGTIINLCTAYGLGTLVMEGINSIEISKLLKIPDGYKVSCVCAIGYPAEDAHQYITKRYNPDQVIFENEFGKPMPNVPHSNL